MNKDMKETLERVADYNKIERQRVMSVGNIAFCVSFFICAAAIIAQFAMFSNIRLIAGETLVLVISGIVYIVLLVRGSLWDAASGGRRTVINDGILSVVISAVFSVLYTMIIYPRAENAVRVSRVCVLFFAGISVLCFVTLRIIAVLSNKKHKQNN